MKSTGIAARRSSAVHTANTGGNERKHPWLNETHHTAFTRAATKARPRQSMRSSPSRPSPSPDSWSPSCAAIKCADCYWISFNVHCHSEAEPARGSVTAEFAVVIPAVILVLAVSLGGLQSVGRQIQLQDVAALAARSEARGEDAAALVRRLVPEASMKSEVRGNLVCIRLYAPGAPVAALLGVGVVSAMSCALADGR